MSKRAERTAHQISKRAERTAHQIDWQVYWRLRDGSTAAIERDIRRVVEANCGWLSLVRYAQRRWRGGGGVTHYPIVTRWRESDDRGTLWVMRFSGVPGVRIMLVEVKNATKTKSGRRRSFVIPIDIQMRPMKSGGKFGAPQRWSVLNAVASTFGLRGHQYKVLSAS